MSAAAVMKSGGLEYIRQNCPLMRADMLSVPDDKKELTFEKGESSRVHIDDAENMNNNPPGITFNILDGQGN